MSTALTTGHPWRVIALFSVPLLIGNVVQQLYQVVDAIVVGRQLGVDALAAVGATGSMLFLLLGFAWGLTSGFAIPTAQAFGAGDLDAVRRSVATGTMLTGGMSAALSIGAPFLAEPTLRLLQTPPELLAEATVFTQVSFVGASAVMFFNYLSAVIRGGRRQVRREAVRGGRQERGPPRRGHRPRGGRPGGDHGRGCARHPAACTRH